MEQESQPDNRPNGDSVSLTTFSRVEVALAPERDDLDGVDETVDDGRYEDASPIDSTSRWLGPVRTIGRFVEARSPVRWADMANV